MPLSVVIHLSTELAVEPRILARHVVGGVSGARLDHPALPHLDRRHKALALLRIGGRQQQRLAPRGGEGIAERREDQQEEEEHEAEEGRRDEVQ